MAAETVATGCVLAMCVAFVVAQIVVARGATVPEKVPDTGSTVGWVGVACAICCFGSYALPIKADRVQRAAVHPIVFQQFMGSGVVCCSALVLVEVDFMFSWWGVLGAFLWPMASIFAYNAIRAVGMATGIAVWGGLTVLVSFVWGAVAFGQHVHDVLGAAAALLVLVAGIGFAASAQTTLPAYFASKIGCVPAGGTPAMGSPEHGATVYAAVAPDKDAPPVQLPPPPLLVPSPAAAGPSGGVGAEAAAAVLAAAAVEEGVDKDGVAGAAVGACVPPPPPRTLPPTHPPTLPGPSSVVRGILWAVLVGLFNGSMMAPFEMYSRDDRVKHRAGNDSSKAYLISFGIGVAAINPLLLALAHLVARLRGEAPPALHFGVTLAPGFLCGVFWSAGNFGSIYATQYLGSTLGFPLTQCAIAVVGLWGVLYFREIVGKAAVWQFAVSIVLISAGAMWLVNSAG